MTTKPEIKSLESLLQKLPEGAHEIPVRAQGGLLSVRFNKKTGDHFREVWLCGPATRVFHGYIKISQK